MNLGEEDSRSCLVACFSSALSLCPWTEGCQVAGLAGMPFGCRSLHESLVCMCPRLCRWWAGTGGEVSQCYGACHHQPSEPTPLTVSMAYWCLWRTSATGSLAHLLLGCRCSICGPVQRAGLSHRCPALGLYPHTCATITPATYTYCRQTEARNPYNSNLPCRSFPMTVLKVTLLKWQTQKKPKDVASALCYQSDSKLF